MRMSSKVEVSRATESPSEQATRKLLGYLVMLSCVMLCTMGLIYYTLKMAPPAAPPKPSATPTMNSKPPPMRSLSA
jgi:hypothetical protein